MNETTGVLKDKSTGRTYNATVTKVDDTVSIVLEMQAPDAVPYQNSIPDRGKLFDVMRAHFEETEGAFVNVSALDDDQLILKIVGLGFNEEFVLSAFVG